MSSAFHRRSVEDPRNSKSRRKKEDRSAVTEINQSADDSYAGYEAESSRNRDLSWIDRIPVEVETHLTKTERALLDALREFAHEDSSDAK